MMAALSFLKDLPWKLLGILVAFIVCTIGGCQYGESIVTTRWDAERVQTANALQQLAVKQATVTTQVVTEYVDRIQVVKERGKDIIKEVKVYVPSTTTCDLPGGFRVLHDAAAQGELPDATRITDAPAASAQDVASTVADNYATYHEVAEQLKALQGWVRKQEPLQ